MAAKWQNIETYHSLRNMIEIKLNEGKEREGRKEGKRMRFLERNFLFKSFANPCRRVALAWTPLRWTTSVDVVDAAEEFL